MKKQFTLILIIGCFLLISGCNTNTQSTEKDNMMIANPASVYCEENGGILDLIFDNGESYGICYFEDGSSCEEREFYNNECYPKNKTLENNEEKKICSTDVKICPDGSSVLRSGENCEYEDCPTQDEEKIILEEEQEKTIKEIIEDHKKTTGYQEEGLTEEDIDLMEAIIEKLK